MSNINKKQINAVADNIQFLINAMAQPITTEQNTALEGLKAALTSVFGSIEGVQVSDKEPVDISSITNKIDIVGKELSEHEKECATNVEELNEKIEKLTKLVGTLTDTLSKADDRIKQLENANTAAPLPEIVVFKGKEEINGVELEYSAAQLPAKKYSTDSGFDGFVCFPDGFATEETIQPGETKRIPLGIQCNIPEGYEIQVRPRSGNTSERINVGWGTVDNKYVGIIKANVSNDTKEPYTVKQGDKICQLILAKVEPSIIRFNKEGEELKKTDRGSNGFGSSGR